MTKKVLFGLTAMTLGVTGCGLDMPEFIPYGMGPEPGYDLFQPMARGGGADWTILVHLSADNDLYRFGLEDLNEMEAGLNSDRVNVIVLFDGAKKGDSAVLRIKRDPKGMNTTLVSEVLDDGGELIPPSREINSGDPALSAKFANWAFSRFPARRTMMAFWDHGNGIFEGRRDFITKGWGWDDSGTHMNTRDLGPILSAGASALGRPVDIVGFDACLMAHVEMAYQAKGVANYLVASEELEPGAGWDYQGWLKAVSANPAAGPEQVGGALVDTMVRSYLPGGSQNSGSRQTSATLSLTNINALTQGLVPAVNELSQAMIESLPADKAKLVDVRGRTATFDNRDCADLGHFLHLLKSAPVSPAVQAAAQNVEVARRQAVVHNATTETPAVALGSGLVIYFPTPTQTYNRAYSDPRQIAYGSENWKDYLLASRSQLQAFRPQIEPVFMY